MTCIRRKGRIAGECFGFGVRRRPVCQVVDHVGWTWSASQRCSGCCARHMMRTAGEVGVWGVHGCRSGGVRCTGGMLWMLEGSRAMLIVCFTARSSSNKGALDADLSTAACGSVCVYLYDRVRGNRRTAKCEVEGDGEEGGQEPWEMILQQGSTCVPG